ncbi:hypothetical protein LTR56_000980 [Elasticomyces elasticus]|nr:hypothetical protein LTR22_013196 [Elasticomyces elasticus]KAK3660054.1 hypothetical protein LTR56_000980 [Elasticomyces elasticus]KAK4911055.1 hypothetical protein LTR49_020318 [Elasticomyces elasticus]
MELSLLQSYGLASTCYLKNGYNYADMPSSVSYPLAKLPNGSDDAPLASAYVHSAVKTSDATHNTAKVV